MNADQIMLVFLIGIMAISSSYIGFLTKSGGFMAFLIGYFVLLGFGIKGLILMGVFFIPSSLLSKFRHRQKEFLKEIHEKGSSRDWAQVAANGGTAALAGVAHYYNQDPIWMIPFAVALATASADTWASEIGVLSNKSPFSLRHLHRVAPGTSGAISGLGTWASAAGSGLISVMSVVLFQLDWWHAMAIMMLGFGGAILDTILGAYSQAAYTCPSCGMRSERSQHCGVPSSISSGSKWINNDAVNFLSGFSVSLVGLLLYKFL